jgi:hypothetical protein
MRLLEYEEFTPEIIELRIANGRSILDVIAVLMLANLLGELVHSLSNL